MNATSELARIIVELRKNIDILVEQQEKLALKIDELEKNYQAQK